MFVCPHCQKELQPQRGAKGVVWGCPFCQGHAASLGVLRNVFGPERVAVLWADMGREPGCNCPACQQTTKHVTWIEDGQSITLDLCRRCQFVWFDPKEYESIAPAPPKPLPLGEIDESKLSPEAREKLALAEVERLRTNSEQNYEPEKTWETLAGYLGLPVEINETTSGRAPVATYGITAAIAAVTLFEFLIMAQTHDNRVVERFGLIPAEWSRDHGLTFVTSFFLHGGALHLVGNLYFLVVFGRHVETFLGSTRCLLLLATAALIGDVLDVLLTSDSMIPTIGASGGISGLLAFYALKFPHARLAVAFRVFYDLHWMTISAWSAFAIWIALQVIGGIEQMAHVGSVASLAHLGGALAGVGAYFLWRNLDARPGFEFPAVTSGIDPQVR